MPNSVNKSTVKYRSIGCEIQVSHRANIKTIDDPRPHLANAHWVHTSIVEKVYEDGTFETRNTLYVPE